MPTRDERITELQQSIQRHKALAIILTRSITILEQTIGALVGKLHALQQDSKTVDDQINEAEATLNHLLRAAQSEPEEVALSRCTECGSAAVNPNTDHCMKCGSPQRIGGDPVESPSPASPVAAPDSPQSNQ